MRSLSATAADRLSPVCHHVTVTTTPPADPVSEGIGDGDAVTVPAPPPKQQCPILGTGHCRGELRLVLSEAAATTTHADAEEAETGEGGGGGKGDDVARFFIRPNGGSEAGPKAVTTVISTEKQV